MSGMKYTGMALAVTLSAALIFSACGKKEKKVEQPVETDSVVEFSMDDSTEAIPTEIIPEIDPNESYAAQVQAELGDVEIPTTEKCADQSARDMDRSQGADRRYRGFGRIYDSDGQHERSALPDIYIRGKVRRGKFADYIDR